VPLGGRSLVGVVWGVAEGDLPVERLRPVVEALPVPPLRPELRRFVERVAVYTMAPPGSVLRMTMSVGDALQPPRPRRVCAASSAGLAALSGIASAKSLTPARQRVLKVLRDGLPITAPDLARAARCGPGVIRELVARGLVEERLAPAEPPVLSPPDWRLSGPALSPDQSIAARRLVDGVTAGGFNVTVLDGVTGSGKTETYFAALAAALAAGRQVLVLLPEIALGAQWLERFRKRFGALPAQWHSDIGGAERRDTWRAVITGRARVVVGARSALFLPFPELGLIIVDEEHDPSYKQEDGVIYQARDMAVLRASLDEIPIVLVSATPSLETVVNVARGRYGRVTLPRRHAAAELPVVRLVDMRSERIEAGRFLAPPLVAELATTFEAGEQALLFLNRRGYAPLTLCRACGHRFQCPSCTAWLVEHRFTGRLLCHHCGHAEAVPACCPECLAAGALVPCGPGVERLLEEVTARFPAVRAALMVSDLLPGPRAAAELAQAMTERRYDLLIGTQIVAKGHHFPMLTLVGVVDADLGLTGGDLRAAERTYQLLHQVGGRAGRAEHKGRVLIQTWMPDQPVMKALAAGDRDRFLEAEAAARRSAGLPPFGRLAALIISAGDAESADFAARALARSAPQLPGVMVLGPAPAPLAVLRGRHRRRFLVKAGREVNLQSALRAWLSRVRVQGSVRLQVDIDPYSFL
jgi:primosomal protein N' (replication factor Y) (superfamily II helicase)